MIGLSAARIAEIVGAELIPAGPHPAGAGPAVAPGPITSVEFDSRHIRAGALFVALSGERVDGHDFAAAARTAGALAVLGAGDGHGELPQLRTADDAATLTALAALAHASVTALSAAGLTVIGMTGSSGKTSTKDLIAALLTERAGAAAVVAPRESFNNELGHPYTVLRAGPDTSYLVLELSARNRGHIAELSAIAPPKIGAVLNVGSAHLGEFGSVDAIAAAKGELVEALPAAADGGVAVLNADDHRVLAMAARTTAAVVTTGRGADADVRAVEVRSDDRARAAFTLCTPEGQAEVALQVAGAHQVDNALAAAAVARATGMGLADIAGALSRARAASKWRMEITDRADGVTVINDAYNANPESMRSALQSLATIGTGRRTWAVLGEMAELGTSARAAHDEIGRLAVRLGVARLVVVGQAARALHLGAALEGSFNGESELVDDVPTAIELLSAQLLPGDVLLVKASRSVGLDRVAAALLAGERGAA